MRKNSLAKILDIKLKYLDDWNNKRRNIADIYNEKLGSNKDICIPAFNANCSSNYHIYVIICKNRDGLKSYLENNNIGCAIHYPKPFYKREAYKNYLKLTSNLNTMNGIEDKLLS